MRKGEGQCVVYEVRRTTSKRECFKSEHLDTIGKECFNKIGRGSASGEGAGAGAPRCDREREHLEKIGRGSASI